MALSAVFMGTPQFAATILQKVLDSSLVTVKAVYTQPDRPAGRGKALKASEVKELALAHGLPVLQPLRFAEPGAVETLAAFKPDLLLVAAYGLILPQRVLDIPLLYPLNVHASLLPRYRGAAPIQRAVMAGDTVTGVTIMKMEAGLDSGPMMLQQAMGIGINDTAGQLHIELAEAGAALLLESIKRISEGREQLTQQESLKVSVAPKLTKEEGLVDFSRSVAEVHAHIRGVTPWPGARLVLKREGQEDLFLTAEPGPYPFHALSLPRFAADEGAPGSIAGLAEGTLLVRCKDGYYAFSSLRPAGKKVMTGQSFYNGYLASASAARF